MKILRLISCVLIFILTISCGLLPLGELDLLLEKSTPQAAPLDESIMPNDASEEIVGESPVESASSEEGSPLILAANLPYGIQPGNPIRTSSWLHDCKWMGVAGQVFDAKGNPINNIIVEAGGRLIGQPVLGLSITGIDHGYGPGGYEIMLASQPIKSSQLVWVQLKDTAGKPLSQQVYINTSDACAENLVILNFLEGGLTAEKHEYYFPVINK